VEREGKRMEIKTFKDMYIAELQELASVVRQIGECLPHVAQAASHPALKRVILDNRHDTALQKERLELILHGAEVEAHTDQAMQAMVYETNKMLPMLKGDDLRDAGLIASIQRLKHYEIAAYGTAAALAGQLELRDDQDVLLESLEEEKLTDVELTALAEREVNPDAVTA
jgi:ferritin-like metal-binding protein YciE